jgi:DNA-binding NtrC family response regulator
MSKQAQTVPEPTRARTKTVTHGPSIHATQMVPNITLGRMTPEATEGTPGPGTPPPVAPRALRIEREGIEPLVVTLYPDKTYVFGRAPESSFVFPSDAVSRLHAQLRFDGDAWMYRDLNSRNGSFLLSQPAPDDGDPRQNGRTIGANREHRARAGETVLLGNGTSRLSFLDEVPADSAQTVSGIARKSKATVALERQIEVCARHRLPVFLLGPSGCGKTFVARAIHDRSQLPGLFVILNCGRLPADAQALASELLGHVRGAYTGAVSERKGKIWSADGGTLFLDEVESLPRAAQDFLLDVLEGSGSYAPYGAPVQHREVPPRFRLISASKVSLRHSGLRPDLCQRLGAADVLLLPTLEDRRADIPYLIEAFLEQLRVEQRIDAELTTEAVNFLQHAKWPGEVRELQSTVRVVASREHANQQLDGTRPQKIVVGVQAVRSYLEQRHVGFGEELVIPRTAGPATAEHPKPRKRPTDLTAEDVHAALQAHGGNKTRAAKALGIVLNTLKAKLRAAR